MMFTKSAEVLSQHNHEMTSIKITGLIDMKLLKSLNDSVNARNRFWQENSSNGMMTAQQAFTGYQKLSEEISDDDFE